MEAGMNDVFGPDAGVTIGPCKTLVATYTNWRGETRERNLWPIQLWYGSTEWHPEPQWFLRCHDMDELGNTKDFALSGFTHPPVEVRPAVERVAAVVGRLRELMATMGDGERMMVKESLQEGYCRECWAKKNGRCCCTWDD